MKEIPTKIDDLGVCPHFRKPPYVLFFSDVPNKIDDLGHLGNHHMFFLSTSSATGESAEYFGRFEDALAVSSHTRRVVDAWFSEPRRIVAMLWPRSGTHGANMAGALRRVRRQKPQLQRQDGGLMNVGNLNLP